MLESYRISDEGFHPFLIKPNWQVAQLNYMCSQSVENINKVEKHNQTDEVFVLTEGKAIMIIATFEGKDKINFDLIFMTPFVVYNVPKTVWHNIIMNKEAKVLIVENANTHVNDVIYFTLNDLHIKEIKNKSQKFII